MQFIYAYQTEKQQSHYDDCQNNVWLLLFMSQTLSNFVCLLHHYGDSVKWIFKVKKKINNWASLFLSSSGLIVKNIDRIDTIIHPLMY
ncbi:hypothetical protein BLA29_000134 [Euroglyphus maynei]|uniref:Uncharacterized protein n=1 Tax=Euroglyphus maynei TaxID=6958 RepID=A0A1Y3ATG8_EURMA|nr:hypothetical protein BLA29_000134 [Euroglyphus maynei]